MRDLFTILLIFISQVVTSQPFLPIVTPANSWTVAHFETGASTRRIYRFSLSVSVINGKNCRELKYEDSLMGAHSTGRFYYEENGIVYASNGEAVYDLGLGVSDTLPSSPAVNMGPRTVMSVGTVILNDTLPRKIMTVRCAADSLNMPVTVIEGIGDLEDFFFSERQCIQAVDGENNYILCYSVNGQTVFLKPGENCELSATNQPDDSRRLKVFPNPVAENLVLDFSKGAHAVSGQILIFDVLGQLLILQDLEQANGQIPVDVSALKAGMYRGVFTTNQGKTRDFVFEKILEK